MGHTGTGEFTIHFFAGSQGLHWLTLAQKVYAPLVPKGGGGVGGQGFSNDWCINIEYTCTTLESISPVSKTISNEKFKDTISVIKLM